MEKLSYRPIPMALGKNKMIIKNLSEFPEHKKYSGIIETADGVKDKFGHWIEYLEDGWLHNLNGAAMINLHQHKILLPDGNYHLNNSFKTFWINGSEYKWEEWIKLSDYMKKQEEEIKELNLAEPHL